MPQSHSVPCPCPIPCPIPCPSPILCLVHVPVPFCPVLVPLCPNPMSQSHYVWSHVPFCPVLYLTPCPSPILFCPSPILSSPMSQSQSVWSCVLSMIHSGTGTHDHSYKPAGISFTLVSFSGMKLLAVAHILFVPSKIWKNKNSDFFFFFFFFAF